MLDVTLDLPSLGSARYLVDRLDGNAELLAEPGDPQAARKLLAHVLRDAEGAAADCDELLATWRDRLLASVFEREFGDRVESRSNCGECGESFEFGFDLSGIMAQQDEAARGSGLVLDGSGEWPVGDGRLRPPRLADLASADSLENLRNTLIEGDTGDTDVEQLLEQGAPLLDFDVEATCPECSASQQAHFEIGRYLVDALATEHAFLLRETHLIASRYGWDHPRIMALPRRHRQAYAALIENERSAALARRA